MKVQNGSLIEGTDIDIITFRFCLDDSLSYRAMLIFSHSHSLGILMRVWTALNELKFNSRENIKKVNEAYNTYISSPPIEMQKITIGIDVLM